MVLTLCTLRFPSLTVLDPPAYCSLITEDEESFDCRSDRAGVDTEIHSKRKAFLGGDENRAEE